MTGPDHYAEAERLLALAERHSSGATYGPEWTLTLAAAQVHATLALAAATAGGTAGPDSLSVHIEQHQPGGPDHYVVDYDVWNHRDSLTFAKIVRTDQAE